MHKHAPLYPPDAAAECKIWLYDIAKMSGRQPAKKQITLPRKRQCR
ncbi:hypothetical protein ANACOL_02485 [Anaerotruncus colihominis DSM 17241]|uniref:Uncharacterized protein n=1 Tax=Anaerotruncus colihominis DSM 17241 TaxID=445972 RepID=B0PCH5_9FIRM|nr:hypothetical protein ANACOL_02485 [Anaerotruncus colihominis DSM 17241]